MGWWDGDDSDGGMIVGGIVMTVSGLGGRWRACSLRCTDPDAKEERPGLGRRGQCRCPSRLGGKVERRGRDSASELEETLLELEWQGCAGSEAMIEETPDGGV